MTKRVLVVDDEPNIVMSLKFLMEREGFLVEIASSGEMALQAMEQRSFDLVLLDVMMPKLDGFEICQRIKANRMLCETRVMMLTAKGREIERDKGLALGADDYVTKPFSTRDLVVRVKEILNTT